MNKFILLLLASCFTALEMEIHPARKTCYQQLFSPEPISVTATVTEAPSTKFSIYITFEDDQRRLITHKKYDIESKSTVLTFNNPVTRVIRVCIDNFESYSFIIDL